MDQREDQHNGIVELDKEPKSQKFSIREAGESLVRELGSEFVLEKGEEQVDFEFTFKRPLEYAFGYDGNRELKYRVFDILTKFYDQSGLRIVKNSEQTRFEVYKGDELQFYIGTFHHKDSTTIWSFIE